jgi:hypothetical protein
MMVFRPVLLSGRNKTAALYINVLPSQVQDFPQAATREEQQAKCCRRGWGDLGEALGLWHVLGGGPGFVHRPWDAGDFRLTDCAAQPF